MLSKYIILQYHEIELIDLISAEVNFRNLKILIRLFIYVSFHQFFNY